MRGRLVAFMLLAAVATAQAEQPQLALVVHNAGIYVGKFEGHVPHEGLASGRLLITSGDTLVTPTDTVCARLGVSFGFEYTITGAPTGTSIDIDYVTRFPAHGVVNADGKKFVFDKITDQAVIGTRDLSLYMFEEPWELVAGTWTFEFHHNGRKFGEKSFTVLTECPLT